MTARENANKLWFGIRGDPAWKAADEEFTSAFVRRDNAAISDSLARMAEAFDSARDRLLDEFPLAERDSIAIELNLLAARSCGAI